MLQCEQTNKQTNNKTKLKSNNTKNYLANPNCKQCFINKSSKVLKENRWFPEITGELIRKSEAPAVGHHFRHGLLAYIGPWFLNGGGSRKALVCDSIRPKLQALVYDILPSTTAVFNYAIGSRKLSANEQFFVGAQTVVSLLQTTQIKQSVSFIAANKVYNQHK